MSFLDELKAQKGIGKKPVPPPKVEKEPELPKVQKKPKLPVRICADGTCDNVLLGGSDEKYCSKHVSHHVESKPDKPVLNSSLTREKWLETAFERINGKLFGLSDMAPYCRLSVGFPAGSRPKKTTLTLGQYWPPGATSDGVPQIFISPSKHASGDPVEMLAVLVHEMVHAAIYPTKGHGKAFKRLALKVGLTGPMRHTVASNELRDKLKAIADDIGPFPHGTIDPTARPGKKGKLRGYECDSCGFKFYTTQKWVDVAGDEMVCPDNKCNGIPRFVPPKS